MKKQIEQAQAAVSGSKDQGNEQRSIAYGRLGQIYQAYGLLDVAVPCYRNAQALNQNEFKWPYYLGFISQAKGDLQQALEAYSSALRLRPDDDVILLRVAEANLKLNRLDQADQLYKKVLAKNSQNVAALDGIGRVALARRQFSVAAEVLNRALTINPRAAFLHYPLAMAYRGLGEVEKAQAELAKHGPAAPELEDAYLTELQEIKTGKSVLWSQASQQMAAGKFGDAIASYRQLLESNPNDLVARTYLGTALARAGNPDEAIQQLSEVVRKSPTNSEANYCLGVIYANVGKDAEAIEHFRTTIKGDPQFAEVHFQLANVLMRTRSYAEAAEEYSKAIERNPDDTFSSLMKSLALVRLQRYADARQVLEEANRTHPTNLDIVNALARLLSAAPDDTVRNGRRALELMQPISKTDAVELDQAETIAMAMAETGNFSKAVGIQRSIVDSLGTEDPARVASLTQTLALYEKEQPCRTPWRDDDPIFVPAQGSGDALPNAGENKPQPHEATQINLLIPVGIGNHNLC